MKKVIMRPVNYQIMRETDKAVYVEIYSDWARNTDCLWIPKSLCEFQTYVETTDYKDNPETYGKRVVAVADWFLVKNKVR